MPRKKRVAGKRRYKALTYQEEFDLLIGSGGVQWSDDERREAWQEHKDELMTLVNPGTHPAAFYDYEDSEES